MICVLNNNETGALDLAWDEEEELPEELLEALQERDTFAILKRLEYADAYKDLSTSQSVKSIPYK